MHNILLLILYTSFLEACNKTKSISISKNQVYKPSEIPF